MHSRRKALRLNALRAPYCNGHRAGGAAQADFVPVLPAGPGGVTAQAPEPNARVVPLSQSSHRKASDFPSAISRSA